MESRRETIALLFTLCLSTTLAAPIFFGGAEPELQRSKSQPKPPVFPAQYEVKYKFSMPYTKALQYDALSYDVHLWYDADKDIARIETLNGLDTTLKLKKGTFEIVPTITEFTCIVSHNDKKLRGGATGIPINMTDWTFGGKTTAQGRKANLWVKSVKMFDRVEYYYYYVALDDTPLYLSVMGQDWFTGAHFDQYIAEFEYDSWKPGPIDKKMFKIPKICLSGGKPLESTGMGNGAIRMQGLVPRIYRGDSEYDSHYRKHGRKHSGPAEYHMRAHLFNKNKLMVTEHNSKAERSYSLGLNKFADWTEEEFKATMLGYRGDKSLKDKLRAEAPVYSYVHKKQHKLPKEVDWEGTPSDGIVKDQASCGSCWVFGAVSTMEAAWYQATKQQLALSEQQVVDCAWDYHVDGCDGGFSESAIKYVAENGGIMTNVNYEYIGQDDWCRFNTTSQKKAASAFFTGFSTVKKNVESVKSAVHEKGPLAVALDASDLHFRFYTEGVYNSSVCDESLLDHVVTLVGYGEERGMPYFKLRNSWSKYWGNEGYIKILQENDCGVKTDAVFAMVDKDKAAEALERAAQLP